MRVRTYGFPGCFTRPPGTSTRNHPHESTTSKPVVPGDVCPFEYRDPPATPEEHRKTPSESVVTAATISVVTDSDGQWWSGSVQAPPATQETPEGYIAVVCKCGQKLQAREKYAGTRVRCPSCRNFLILPGEPLRESMAPQQIRPLLHERSSGPPPAAKSQAMYWAVAAVAVVVLVAAVAFFAGGIGKRSTGGAGSVDGVFSER